MVAASGAGTEAVVIRVSPSIDALQFTQQQSDVRLRGRDFSAQDLNVIRDVVRSEYMHGRTRISQVVCDRLGWLQPNGWPKDRACRDVLLRLEQFGVIDLPPISPIYRPRKPVVPNVPSNEQDVQSGVTHVITKLTEPLELILAKGNRNEMIWNRLVNRYHYLGHSISVGRTIKYLVKHDGIVISAISFSSPAWRLKKRDEILEGVGIARNMVHDTVINNSRFLIIPGVKIANLASMILSMSTARIVGDWCEYYAVTPLVAETFVEHARFAGTCYRAANWLHVGYTRGYSKAGGSHYQSEGRKSIFLYGLSRPIRKRLAGLMTG